MSWRLIPFFTMISIVYGFGTLTNLQFSRLPIRVLRRAWSVKQLSSASSSESSGAVLDRSYSLCLSIPTSEDMEDVGALLSVLSNPPDVLFLDGGKAPRLGS